VLRVTWRLDNSSKGPQLGRLSGATVGTAVQTFQFTSATKATFSQLAKLPTGTIRTSGILNTQAFTQKFRVIGGSGAFAKARGTFELTPLPDSQGQVYYLRLP
jgi:Dirigent-like protein